MSARRCHLDDCTDPARYSARLDWTAQPEVLLCVEHAAAERGWASVIKIENADRAASQPEPLAANATAEGLSLPTAPQETP